MEFDLNRTDAETFIRSAQGPDNVKLADAAGLFIARKLRERSFARQVLTPKPVTARELKPSTNNHDQLVFIDEKEINVGPAYAINFKAWANGKYISIERYEIPIFEISTDEWSKREIELLAIQQPVTKILEENLVRQIEETEDGFFLAAADSAASIAGNVVSYSTGAGGALTKGAIKVGMNLIERNRLLCRTVLMSKLTYNDFYTMTYQDIGNLAEEVTVEGYKYYNVGGLKMIVSIKDDLFLHPSLLLASGDKAHMVYFFAEEKALGRFLVLDTTKFGVRRIYSLLNCMAWEAIGMAIANAPACARVTLID